MQDNFYPFNFEGIQKIRKKNKKFKKYCMKYER